MLCIIYFLLVALLSGLMLMSHEHIRQIIMSVPSHTSGPSCKAASEAASKVGSLIWPVCVRAMLMPAIGLSGAAAGRL